jgi:hypothetical protein
VCTRVNNQTDSAPIAGELPSKIGYGEKMRHQKKFKCISSDKIKPTTLLPYKIYKTKWRYYKNAITAVKV